MGNSNQLSQELHAPTLSTVSESVIGSTRLMSISREDRWGRNGFRLTVENRKRLRALNRSIFSVVGKEGGVNRSDFARYA
jgi:hypothetical protein